MLNVPEEERDPFRNIVIVGGGATGVEIAGVLSEVRKYAVPKNYRNESLGNIRICLVSSSILASMSEKSWKNAEKALKGMGIDIIKGKRVVDYVGDQVIMDDGTSIRTKLLISVSGVKAVALLGIPESSLGHAGRILCDGQMRVKDTENVFAAGDIALTSEEKYPKGHPQLAQVAGKVDNQQSQSG